MDQDKLKHLEFIQNVITRMNTNSFQIKGLTITIVAALAAVFASTQKISFILIAIPPAIIFWFLDAFYLQQERKFRGVYNDVAGITDNIKIKPFEMPINKYTGGKYCYFNVFKSKTIFLFYFPIIVLLVLAVLILLYIDC